MEAISSISTSKNLKRDLLESEVFLTASTLLVVKVENVYYNTTKLSFCV